MKETVYRKQTKYGVFYSNKDPKEKKSKILKRLLVLIPAVIFFVYYLINTASNFLYFEEGKLTFDKSEFSDYWIFALFCVLFLALSIFGIVKYAVEIKNIDKLYKLFLEEAKEANNYNNEHVDELFYQKCANNNIFTTSKADVARMKIIAKEMEIEGSESEIIEMFTRGKSIIDKANAAIAEQEKKERIRILHEKELKEETENTKYINLFGSDKRIKMLSDMADSYRSAIENYNEEADSFWNKSQSFYKSVAQKEKDWATAGGVASAIAGGAAGFAVATDIQRQNAEIRASNTELRDTIYQVAAQNEMDILIRKSNAKERLKECESEIQAARLKVVESLPQNHLLELLSPTIVETKTSETGAINFKITVNKNIPLKIYDTVDAVVDGSFKLKILSDKKLVGEAYFTLGIKGSDSYPNLDGICTSLPPKHEEYTYVFEPHKLFAIEK